MRTIKSYVKRKGRITEGQNQAINTLWTIYGIDYSKEFLNFPFIFNNNNPGFATLLVASLTGLLLHYRLDPKIAIKEARLLLRQKLFNHQLE